jgi:hypothetical protein
MESVFLTQKYVAQEQNNNNNSSAVSNWLNASQNKHILQYGDLQTRKLHLVVQVRTSFDR